MSNTPSKKSNLPATSIGRYLIAASLVAILIVAGIGLFFLGPTSKGLPSPEECLRLERLKNIALAHLELAEYEEADKRLVELVKSLPTEPLGPRNLAICRLLWLESKDGPKPPLQAVQSALAALSKREPNALLPHLLAAKWELRTDPNATMEETKARQLRAIAEFQRSGELASESPVPRYLTYQFISESGNPALADTGRKALREAYELTPDNLWLLKDILDLQADEKDPTFRDTLASARERLAPVHELVRRRSDYDVAQHLADAAHEAEQGNWPLVKSLIMAHGNIIKPEDSLQSDLRHLSPHLLEFADYEFSAAFRARLAEARRDEPAPIRVKLVRAAPDDNLAQLAEPRALAVTDFDLNGTPDLLVLREQELVVLGRAEPDDAWSQIARLEIPTGFTGILTADLDEDEEARAVTNKQSDELPIPAGVKLDAERYSIADQDVVLFGPAGILILRNDRDRGTGRRTLVPVELAAELLPQTPVTAAVLVDFYHDGDLDLVLSTARGVVCWSNLMGLKFGDLTKFSILPPPETVFTSLVAVDWDRDADIDVLASGPSPGTLGILENQRHGQFRWRAFDKSFGELDASQGLAVLEADGNISWDLAGASSHGVGLALTATVRRGVNRPIRSERISPAGHAGVRTWDYDNDTWQDLVAWSEDSLAVLRGSERGTFKLAESVFDHGPKGMRDVAIADLDFDGDLDLIVAEASGVALYDNDGGNQNHWLRINLRGTREESVASGRVNHNGIGSMVEIRAGARYQAQVGIDQSLHFGLGQLAQADVARVVWPNGLPQSIVEPQANEWIQELLDLKTSCPYLYTWNGERYEFLTDLLWAAPLGLQFAEGKLAPWREWEYLKIPGERLVANDGRYSLQITEELWEAVYFDHIELLAVDHPADVEIYSNDKVGPPEISEFKVHTVRAHRTPVAARDKHGRSALEEIRRRDGVYFRGFDGRILQGLTDEHYLELDLGKLDDPRKITLFLTGWIYPTDTSLNVGIGENPALSPPRPPYVLVPDERGNWVEAMDFMGFPGGKTKTIAVDISGIFKSKDYRLRIATSAEICWDEAFFTVDEEPATIEVTSLPLVSADLHYRGFSASFPRLPNTPVTYDYEAVSRVARWPTMGGKFTRYGDVRELLLSVDDCHAVLGAGDEMTLEFAATPVRKGWKRDFLIHNVGWDKDADLNTVHGQTVEPLPFSKMKAYPFAPGENYPDSPRQRRYLREFQTREQSAAEFWKQLQPAGKGKH